MVGEELPVATRTKVVEANGRSKLRFVMLDADLSDGDLSDLMGAITNALRPAALSARSIERPALKASSKLAGADDQLTLDMTEDVGDTEQVEDQEADDTVVKTPRAARKPAEPRQPKYLDDLDMKGNGTSFLDFAKRHEAKKHARRYLVATVWFNEHGKQATVDIDKMYTAYRVAGWPLGRIKDWDSTFRLLRKQDLVKRVKPGEYAVTTVGLGKLQKPEDGE